MNVYTIVSRNIKNAEKLKRDQIRFNQLNIDNFVPIGITPDDIYEKSLEEAFEKHKYTCRLAFDYLNAMEEIKAEVRGRWSMITIRPPLDTPFITFKEDVEKFYNNYFAKHAIEYEYAYEQIGENMDELGKGFHVHIIVKTCKINYYNSHMLRDAFIIFHYVAKNCIKIESIKNLLRAKAYIRGDKNNTEKELGVEFNTPWRESQGLQALYSLPVKYGPAEENQIKFD